MQQTPGDVDAAGVDELVLHLQLATGYGNAAFVAERSAAIGVAAIGDVERSPVVEGGVDLEPGPAEAGGAGINRALVDDLIASVAVIC